MSRSEESDFVMNRTGRKAVSMDIHVDTGVVCFCSEFDRF